MSPVPEKQSPSAAKKEEVSSLFEEPTWRWADDNADVDCGSVAVCLGEDVAAETAPGPPRDSQEKARWRKLMESDEQNRHGGCAEGRPFVCAAADVVATSLLNWICGADGDTSLSHEG